MGRLGFDNLALAGWDSFGMNPGDGFLGMDFPGSPAGAGLVGRIELIGLPGPGSAEEKPKSWFDRVLTWLITRAGGLPFANINAQYHSI